MHVNAARERRSLYALSVDYPSKVLPSPLPTVGTNTNHCANRSIVRLSRLPTRQPPLLLAREQYPGMCGRMRVFV